MRTFRAINMPFRAMPCCFFYFPLPVTLKLMAMGKKNSDEKRSSDKGTLAEMNTGRRSKKKTPKTGSSKEKGTLGKVNDENASSKDKKKR